MVFISKNLNFADKILGFCQFKIRRQVIDMKININILFININNRKQLKHLKIMCR